MSDCICSLCNMPVVPDVGVAEQIKSLRKQRGWTQKELAKRAGMLTNRVTAIETKHRQEKHTLVTLQKFAIAFGKKLVVRFE